MFAPLPALQKSNEKLAKTKMQLTQLRKENKGLERQINNMKGDKYIEKTARQQLDLAKPDEETYIVVKEEPPIKKRAPAQPKQQNVLQPIIDFFGNIIDLF